MRDTLRVARALTSGPFNEKEPDMRLISLLIATTLAISTAPACARDKAQAWAKWVERAGRIEAAMISGEEVSKPLLKSVCSGVTGTVIGQGFQFPRWAQSLIQVCTALKDDWIYSSRKRQCNDVKHAIRALNEATPVAEAPAAAPVALRIAAVLQSAYEGGCVR